MPRSILDFISEDSFDEQTSRNLQFSDDALESGQESYLETFGDLTNVNSRNPQITQSERIQSIADRVYNDRRDLNLNMPQVPEEYSINTSDASVLDNPDIEEVAEPLRFIYSGYNKYADYSFAEYTQNLPLQYSNQQSYDDYIEEILRQRREFSLEDVFLGRFDKEDTPLGEIAVQAIQDNLTKNFLDNVKLKTTGKVNLNGLSLIEGERLFRRNFSISKPDGFINESAEFLRKLSGVQLPVSPIKSNVFDLNSTRSGSIGNFKYAASGLNSTQELEQLARFTGKGIIKKWETDANRNIYRIGANSKDIKIEEQLYFTDFDTEEALKASSFNPSFSVIQGNNSYYESFGIDNININKNINVEVEISTSHYFAFTSDIDQTEIVFSPLYNGGNPFPKKSLLYKQKQLFQNNLQSNRAFLNVLNKEYELLTSRGVQRISYGDATPASGAFTMDDGYDVSKGEFFRVWNQSRAYNRLSRTLRHRSLDNGETRTVLKPNGLVNFAPTFRTSSGEIIKRYMFSIENLAYTDNLNDLPDCEKGPGDPLTGHRGRIMWFPPYNLKFTEGVQSNYDATTFIGRPEPIYTYNKTERTGSLNFTMIVDHPDVVHVKIDKNKAFWERYFKNDKLTLEDPAIQNYLKNRLSENELEQIRRQQALLNPPVKNIDKPVVSQPVKDQTEQEKIEDNEEEGLYGEKILSIYFPNEVTILPRPLDRDNLYGTKVLTDITKGNIGYEDGGKADSLPINARTIDGILVTTTGGLSYDGTSTTGVTFNGNSQYTYLNGTKKLPPKAPCTNGYSDNNNLGLNEDFYYNFEDIIKEKFDGLKNVRVRIVGNASGATVNRITNKKLALERANNTRDWFRTYVENRKQQIGYDTEILEVIVQAKADQEDVNKLNRYNSLISQGRTAAAAALDYCAECDKADKPACKQTRRADIYIEEVDENNQIIDDDGPLQYSVPEIEVTAEGVIDDDENPSPADGLPNLPPISGDIINKLVYTECDFFEYLEINDPLMYKTISERIKYFHPVYHSVTPQGFNSRLTFLQQCLRPADSVGNDGINNYRNLTFGRQPICILRVGDMYHTKVIIESLDISYDKAMQWDMNPEGIGVQTMYCDISLKMKLIGGSSLSGPINRLQNALSYNYYANTEMYDARSDSIVFSNSNNTESTLDQADGGRIVDGIRLSSFNTWNEKLEAEKLAKLRKQSRVTLQDISINPNTGELEFAPLTLQRAQQLGRAPALVAYKDKLGMPLSEDEKRLLNTFYAQRDLVELLPIGDFEKEALIAGLTNSFVNANPQFTKFLKDIIEREDQIRLSQTFTQIFQMITPQGSQIGVQKYIDEVIKNKNSVLNLLL